MNCAQAQPQLCNYMEDLLPELERGELRDHLRECALCSGHIIKQSHFVTDLQRLNFLQPPFDLAQLIKESLKLKSKKNILQSSKLFMLIFISAGVVFIASAGFAVWKYGIHPRFAAFQKKQEEEEKARQEEKEKMAELYLDTLIYINKRLQGETALLLPAALQGDEPAEPQFQVVLPERENEKSK